MKSLPFPNFLRPFPQKLQEQIAKIERFLSTNYGARCRIVGGAVRDRLLALPIKDVDIEVYGIDISHFEEAMERLGAFGVGKSFFVYKYGDIDIALPRQERKTGVGHRGFAVEPASDEREATRRRDFSVNALLYDIKEARIIDYWGGLDDLEARTLRCVDAQTFVEDSLRVLRAMQFSARMAFRIEKRTCELCRGIELDDLPGARIFGEFEKMFYASSPHYGLYALESMAISKKLWAQGLKKEEFFAAAGKMARFIEQAPKEVRHLCFLAIYTQHSSVPIKDILEAIDAPNRYRRALDGLVKLPSKPSLSFVAKLAKKEGLKLSPLACFPSVRDIAMRLGVWESAFDIGVTPKELMEQGFYGKALGEELERRRQERIDALKSS